MNKKTFNSNTTTQSSPGVPISRPLHLFHRLFVRPTMFVRPNLVIERIFKILVIWFFPKEWQKINQAVNFNIINIRNNEIEEPPPILIQMLIIGEDRRFLTHRGFDLYGIARSILNNVARKSRQGASTIEQQLVRTILSDYRPNYKRKLKEILLANMLCQSFTKNHTISTYLNIAYFGTNASGFIAACRRFNINIRQIEPLTASQLVARIKYPESSKNVLSQNIKIESRTRYLLTIYQQYGNRAQHEHDNRDSIQKHQPVCPSN